MPKLNYLLIIGLSLVGLALAFAGVYGITTMQTEPFMWIIVLIAFAFIIARFATGNYFLQGLLVTVLCGCWVGLIHAVFIHQYLRSDPRLKSFYDKFPRIKSPKISMALYGPMVGIILGIVVGILAVIIARMLHRKAMVQRN